MRLLLILLLIGPSFTAWAQLPDVDGIIRPPEVDSSFVELNESIWSARLFFGYKYQSFALKNDNGKVLYRPRRPFSGGIGLSYQTLLLDVGIRFSGNNSEESTSRFDLQTSALIDRYIVSLNIQHYRGFEESDTEILDNFRADIRTTTIRVDAQVFPNHRKISFRTILTGMDRQLQGAGSLLYGGFAGFHKMKGDSSIIPSYQENNFMPEFSLNRIALGYIGISGGYAYIQPVFDNFYLAALITPGIGLQLGNYSGSGTTGLPAGIFAEINAFAAGCFNWRKFYTLLSYTLNANFVNMQESHRYVFNTGKMKLVFGIKI